MKFGKFIIILIGMIVVIGLVLSWRGQSLLAVAQSAPIIGPITDVVTSYLPISDSPESMIPNPVCPKLERESPWLDHEGTGTVVQLKRSADVVVVATFLDQGPVYDLYGDIGADVSFQAPYSNLRFKATEIFKGNIESEFFMPFAGGALSATETRPAVVMNTLPGSPSFENGSTYLIFLNRGYKDRPALDTAKSKTILHPTAFASWFKIIGNAVCPVSGSIIAAYRVSYQVLPKTMDDIKLAMGGVDVMIPATSTPNSSPVDTGKTTPTPFVAGPTPVPPPPDSP